MRLYSSKLLLCCLCFIACRAHDYQNNGERIYQQGRNLRGESLLNKKASTLRVFKSCAGCHGKRGTAIPGHSIRFKDLSDPRLHKVPYTDLLFYRFLDEDLTSDGRKANIGVIWKMNAQDKQDLLDYLKTL